MIRRPSPVLQPIIRSLPMAHHPRLVVDILACGHTVNRDPTTAPIAPLARSCPKCDGLVVSGVPAYDPTGADAQPARVR